MVAQDKTNWLEEAPYGNAYNHCIRLNLDKARDPIHFLNTPEAIYIQSLGDALELLITEDQSRFAEYEDT
ncbi:MAG: hypothetical protein OEU76_04265, partial [Cyclobacteriaceae bacterium]|nr:hypothetical protein [Cyclobacteriaceae bacterium]